MKERPASTRVKKINWINIQKYKINYEKYSITGKLWKIKMPNKKTKKPIMLALSTFRNSDSAVELAFELAIIDDRPLVTIIVTDFNVARYMVGIDLDVFPNIKEQCERELIKEHKHKNSRRMRDIRKKAKAKNIKIGSQHVRTGRFADVCSKIAKKVEPHKIVTTRSKRPAWVRKFFGSAVDTLIQKVNCEVIEA